MKGRQKLKLRDISVHDSRALEDLFTYAPKEVVENILLNMGFVEFTRICGMSKRIREICLGIRERYHERHSEEIEEEMEQRPDIELYRTWIDFAGNNLDWDWISEHQKLSENFIREFQDWVNWDDIFTVQDLSENFIREFQDKIDWDLISTAISTNPNLSEDFFRDFQDRVDWEVISAEKTLSEDFIREFKHRVNWIDISAHQKLSEGFIREFQDKVDWYMIKMYQPIDTYSKKFQKEFRKHLSY